MSIPISKALLLHRIKEWYDNEDRMFAAHAWMAGASFILPAYGEAEEYLLRLIDAILVMPREDFLALAEKLAAEGE